MKQISNNLIEYMTEERSFLCCDLFDITLKSGNDYYIADFDTDVEYNNKTYRHDLFLMIRDQTKIIGEPTVDTLSVTIYTDNNHEDKIEHKNILLACHEGLLDQATVSLRRAYFDPDTKNLIGVADLFTGRAEITNVGGISAKLDIKSVASGLAGLYPVRIFAPTKAYIENSSGSIVTSSTDETTCVIPLKPSKNVLIMV